MEHGGYRAAYPYLSDAILDEGAILYIDVLYEESLRKNRRRFTPRSPTASSNTACPTGSWNDSTATTTFTISPPKTVTRSRSATGASRMRSSTITTT